MRIGQLFKRLPVKVSLNIEQAKKSTAGVLRQEIGAGGIVYTGGIIDSDEFNPKLTGSEAVLQYDKMRRTDAQVSAVLNARQLPILGATAVIDRPDDDEEAAANITDEQLDFARHNLFTRIDFQAFLSHACSCQWAGFSWAEKIYAVVDNQLVLRALAPRLASTVEKWWTDEAGQLIGLQQKVYKGGGFKQIDIPRDKFVHFVHQQEANNAEGISALRSIFKHWLIKDTLYRLEGIRAERFTVGVPVITLPDEYNDAMLTMAETIGKQWKGGEQSYVVKVNGMSIEILSVKGGETLDITKTIQHHNEEIGKALLTQFINYGTTETGSRALGDSTIAFFYDSENAWANEIAAVIERDVIWPTLDLNYANRPRPRLTFRDIGSLSLGALTAALRDLGVNYITPDIGVENALRPKLGLPLREVEEEPEEPVAPRQPDAPEDIEPDDEEDQPDPEGPAAAAEPVEATRHVHLAAQDQVAIRAEDEFWRPLRPVERHISLRAIRGMLDDSRDRVLRILLGLKKDWGPLLADQLRQLYPSGPAALETLTLPDEVVLEAINEVTPVLDGIYDFGEQQVRKELQSQATEKDQRLSRRLDIRRKEIFRRQARMLFRDQIRDDEVAELIGARSRILITRLKRKTEDAAKLMAIDKYRTQGGNAMADADIDTVVGYIFDSVENESRVVASTTVSEALNLGRDAAAERLVQDIEYAQYSSVLDQNSCEQCSQADGFEAAVGSEEYYDATPPLSSSQFGECDGLGQCRCIWTYVLKKETTGQEIPQ